MKNGFGVPSVRAGNPGVIIDNHDYYLEAFADPDGRTVKESIETEILPSDIPDSFQISCLSRNEKSVTHVFRQSETQYIYFGQLVHGEKLSVSNLNAKLSAIELDDHEATVVTYEDGGIFLLWAEEYFFYLYGFDVDLAILVRIAESIP